MQSLSTYHNKIQSADANHCPGDNRNVDRRYPKIEPFLVFFLQHQNPHATNGAEEQTVMNTHQLPDELAIPSLQFTWSVTFH